MRTRTFVFAHRPVPCRLKIRQDECRTPDTTATHTTTRLSIDTRDDRSPNQNLQNMLSEGSQTTLALAHDIVAHTPIQQASNRSRPRPRPKPRVAPLSPMDAEAAIARDYGAVAPILLSDPDCKESLGLACRSPPLQQVSGALSPAGIKSRLGRLCSVMPLTGAVLVCVQMRYRLPLKRDATPLAGVLLSLSAYM